VGERRLELRISVARTLLVTAAVLLAGAAHADAAQRAVPAGWLGVTVDGPIDARDAREWDRMVRAGVETVRAAFSWAALEPHRREHARSGAKIDFASTDALVIAAARRGLELLPVVQWPPRWAAVQPGALNSPPADPDDVRRIFSALVERYGPRGSLWDERPRIPRQPIRAWQVFNEPNLALYWSVQPFAKEYTATLRAAALGIRTADPGAKVVLGGLTNLSWEALRALYGAGARGAFDVVAIHPYTARPADVLTTARYARDVMWWHGDLLPVWITEFSWPAAGGLRRPPAWADGDDAEQARLLNRAIRQLVAARESLGIERVLWYTWLSSEDRRSIFGYSGLRRIHNGNRRSTPALRVFRRWARRLEGCTKDANARICR